MTNPQRSMPAKRKMTLPIAIATVLIAAGAVAGATAVFSSRTQDMTQELTNKLTNTLKATGYVTAEQTAYQKGFASSTQTMTLTLMDGLSEKPVRLLVTNHIKHGPFPGLSSVGQAVIDTEIRFEDPQLQAEIDKAFAGKKPRIHTLIGLGGSTETQIEVPDGKVVDGQVNLAWKPLLGTIKATGQRTDTKLNWPGMTFSEGSEMSGEISGLQLVGDQSRTSAEDKLGLGKSTLTIAKIQVPSPQGMASASNLTLSSESKSSEQNFYDGLAQFNVGELNFADKSLKNLQLHFGLRHLAREPLNRLLTLQNELQSQIQPGSSTPQLTDAQSKQLEQDLQALMQGNPQITLDRLSVNSPSGEILLTGQASAPKLAQLSAQEWQMYSAMPQMLIGLFDVHLEGQAKQQALQELLALFGGESADLTNIQGFVDSGYVSQQGDQLSMKFDIKDGRPVLNGQALGN